MRFCRVKLISKLPLAASATDTKIPWQVTSIDGYIDRDTHRYTDPGNIHNIQVPTKYFGKAMKSSFNSPMDECWEVTCAYSGVPGNLPVDKLKVPVLHTTWEVPILLGR